jgi:hypothetical protein
LIDYLKILILDVDESTLMNSDKLEFTTEVSMKTGALSTKSVANYHFCRVTVFSSGRTYFSGSIHKMMNSLKGITSPNYQENQFYRGYNGNDFTINDVIDAREHIVNLIGCPAEKMILENIELGVNLSLSFTPKLYLKGLLYHQGKMFEFKHMGNYAQAMHQRFIMKIYNKSDQYGMNEDVIRVELKVIKSKEIEGIGVNAFSDITETTLANAKGLILHRFNEVVHYDYTIDKRMLSKTQTKLIHRYSNPRFWIEELKPNERHRHKKRLSEIISKSSRGIHQIVKDELIKKCSTINRYDKGRIVA